MSEKKTKDKDTSRNKSQKVKEKEEENKDTDVKQQNEVIDDEVSDSQEARDTKEIEKETEEVDHPFKYSNETSDLRLVVEGKPLYVSRVILSLVSPVLKSLLAVRGSDDNVDLPLPGQKYDHVVKFLCCIYPDIMAPISEDNVEILLSFADEFQVSRLVEKCEDFLIKKVENSSSKPTPEEVVLYLNISEKFGLNSLQKAAFETAAKTPSDLLENVKEFWELPSVTTTSIFIRRLKILEQSGKTMKSKVKEVQNHCALYHKGDKFGDNVCTKCLTSIGKQALTELKHF